MKVLSLFEQWDGLFQRRDALPDGNCEDLAQADDGEAQQSQRGIVDGLPDLG